MGLADFKVSFFVWAPSLETVAQPQAFVAPRITNAVAISDGKLSYMQGSI
jgi:hypothetical protein